MSEENPTLDILEDALYYLLFVGGPICLTCFFGLVGLCCCVYLVRFLRSAYYARRRRLVIRDNWTFVNVDLKAARLDLLNEALKIVSPLPGDEEPEFPTPDSPTDPESIDDGPPSTPPSDIVIETDPQLQPSSDPALPNEIIVEGTDFSTLDPSDPSSPDFTTSTLDTESELLRAGTTLPDELAVTVSMVTSTGTVVTEGSIDPTGESQTLTDGVRGILNEAAVNDNDKVQEIVNGVIVRTDDDVERRRKPPTPLSRNRSPVSKRPSGSPSLHKSTSMIGIVTPATATVPEEEKKRRLFPVQSSYHLRSDADANVLDLSKKISRGNGKSKSKSKKKASLPPPLDIEMIESENPVQLKEEEEEEEREREEVDALEVTEITGGSSLKDVVASSSSSPSPSSSPVFEVINEQEEEEEEELRVPTPEFTSGGREVERERPLFIQHENRRTTSTIAEEDDEDPITMLQSPTASAHLSSSSEIVFEVQEIPTPSTSVVLKEGSSVVEEVEEEEEESPGEFLVVEEMSPEVSVERERSVEPVIMEVVEEE